MFQMVIATAAIVGLLAGASAATAQAPDAPSRILFTNCSVFDGKADKLASGKNVLVEGNLIKAVGDQTLSAEEAETINCAERTLMPGLIDAHTHLYMNMAGGIGGMEKATWDEIGPRSVHMAV